MPRGGKRDGAGRRKVLPERPEANKKVATEVLALTTRPKHKPDCEHKEKCECKCRCEKCSWWDLLHEMGDGRLHLDARKYLTDKRDGKPVQTVNHVHDKPIDLNVNVSIAEVVRKVRLRKEEYERSRG